MTPNHIQAVAQALTQLDLQFRTDDSKLILGIDLDGITFTVDIYTQREGEVLIFDARGFISTEDVRDSEHRSAFAIYLLQQNFKTSSGSFEMDSNGQVALAFELPMADAQVTVRQVALILDILQFQINSVVSDGHEVLKNGELPESSGRSGSAMLTDLAGLARAHQEMLVMATNEQGRARLVQIANDGRMASVIREMAKDVLSEAGPDEL